MKSLKGSKTEKNIITAFAGESQARNRYTFYSSVAKKEGFEQIAAIFTETADNEKEHAKRLFKLLEGGEVEVCDPFPAGKIGDTASNLRSAAEGENFEHTKLYPQYADIAEQEGYKEVAAIFRSIAVSEKYHDERFSKLLENVKNDMVFKKDESVRWRCRNCGYVHEGEEAPDACPACAHPKAYFEIFGDNY